MQLNTFKTKEMILGRTDSTSIPSLSTPAGPIQRVTTFKLLGLHLDASLSWTTHINTVVSKASKRLYFLKQLKRAGVPRYQLLHFYTAVIRPVLEYASPVWRYPSLALNPTNWNQCKNEQYISSSLFSDTRGMSYPNVLFVANLNSLKDRRDRLSRSFFHIIYKPDSCLHHLLPPSRDTS